MGFVFLYEAAADFCVVMAWKGIYNLNAVFTGAESVPDERAHRLDVERAKELNTAAFLSAVLATLGTYLLVVLFI
jgi:hypothetical protein